MELSGFPLVIEPMQLAHMAAVMQIERESFSLPWPESAYRYEVTQNELAHYYVLRVHATTPFAASPSAWQQAWRAIRHQQPDPDQPVLGYGGFWLMYDEAHISTLAVRAQYRRNGLGELLLTVMLEEAHRLHAMRVTLEVRVSNRSAQALYEKYGFEEVGRRKAYYNDNGEDAVILTTPEFTSPAYQALLTSHRQGLSRRLGQISLDKILQMH